MVGGIFYEVTQADQDDVAEPKAEARTRWVQATASFKFTTKWLHREERKKRTFLQERNS